MEQSERRVLTTQDLAAEYGIPAETWRWWRNTGKGPRSARVGRRVYYNRADVEAWWAEQTTGVAS